MKKVILTAAALLVSGPAMAADLSRPPPARAPVYTKAPPPVVAYSWTGCYLGVEGGYASGRSKHTAASGANIGLDITTQFNMSGGIVGGTIGCNYQTSSVVFGIEDDFSWTNKKGSGADQPPFAAGAASETNEKWIDTLRGRLGFAWDRVLLFATGGGAVANLGVNVCNNVFLTCTTDSANVWGWTVGAGVEWAVWGSWSFKAEYLHVDFGTHQFINPPVVHPFGTTATRNVPVTDELFRIGLNYRFFGGGAVMSGY